MRAVGPDNGYENATNAFEIYRKRALDEVMSLSDADVDVPNRLYGIRNSLAHGKDDVLVPDDGKLFHAAVRALPILKLLARIAVDG